ncbi:GroES-like protein [Sporormia fimetaria CBS 119925]|uniref:L-arabinitol 4-dehydrogenase n=1 Tax=Sporormia fimetaria CBS 119925 TaxID=1340428 RepID=A0A6A6VM32_9PLEO|nr:GroES-like protein [Sporormia fimetaria CBS 119925]
MTSTNAEKPNIGVYTNPSHDLWIDSASPSLEEIQNGATLKEGEVLINVKSTGICGSDIHFWHAGCIGPMIVNGNHILGHESSGQILAVHPSITHLTPGDRVAIEPTIPCLSCAPCLSGRYNGCESVTFLSTPPHAGMLRRYLIHPAKWVYKLPSNLSYEEGALLEPLSVALAGIERAGVKLGDPVLVCGAGPIGLISAICARAAGAAPVLITDIDEGRLEFAKSVVKGVRTHLVTSSQTAADFRAAVVEVMSRGAGETIEPRVALECTGVESSIAGAVESVCFGGMVFVIGVGKNEIKIPFMRCSTREVDLRFQYRYANTWPKAIRLVSEGVVDVKGLVTHRVGLEKAREAFELVAGEGRKEGERVVKVMIQDL